MSSAVREVRGVLLPLHEGFLLLPNAAVSEVVGYREPDSLGEHVEKPDWVDGTLAWRQLRVPMISFERAIGQASGEIGHRARLAICNTLNGNVELPFVAVELKSAPHLVRVTEEILSVSESGDDHPAIAGRLMVNGQEAMIPNLDYLEKTVHAVIRSS